MYKIDDFKQHNRLENIVITQHSLKRFGEREIGIDDVRKAIDSGEIIEQYEDDFPFPSCLILGRSGSRMIHVAASLDEEYIYVITSYIPDPLKWEDDWKTRKGKSK